MMNNPEGEVAEGHPELIDSGWRSGWRFKMAVRFDLRVNFGALTTRRAVYR